MVRKLADLDSEETASNSPRISASTWSRGSEIRREALSTSSIRAHDRDRVLGERRAARGPVRHVGLTGARVGYHWEAGPDPATQACESQLQSCRTGATHASFGGGSPILTDRLDGLMLPAGVQAAMSSAPDRHLDEIVLADVETVRRVAEVPGHERENRRYRGLSGRTPFLLRVPVKALPAEEEGQLVGNGHIVQVGEHEM